MANDTLPTTFQQFIHVSRYARWIDDANRRETWTETVDRYMNYMQRQLEDKGTPLPEETAEELRNAILNLEVFPSMRSIMTAGPALERDNVAGYNCSYLPINDLRCFDEMMYILMCGTGVGYSVEAKHVSQLPEVPRGFRPGPHIVVQDSREGWADAYRQLLEALFRGELPTWDVSLLRPAGAKLKTFGGRSSGPQPLVELFEFTVDVVWEAKGRKLTPLECHDLACKIGEVVVVGGVRRSALISLTDLSDTELATAKSGEWYNTHKHRSLANISTAYETRPSVDDFYTEWTNLIDSKSGERGIFNREAARNQVRSIGRDENHDWGTNPCSEIILRPFQFCNLSTVIVRPEDTFETLERKVRLATILGTIQATLTHFPYLRDIWKQNTEEEALLGVSMTGQFGNKLMSGQLGNDALRQTLANLRVTARRTNDVWADLFGINRAAAITCVKPEGTSSSLARTASGMHTEHARWTIRTVRADIKDPLTQMMMDAGIPWEWDVMNPSNVVFSFPIEASEAALTRHDLTAVEHLELWLAYQEAWCDHKPSITVSIKENEWDEVGAWVWEHFDKVSGIAFLPFTDHVYQQAPFQEVTEAELRELELKIPTDVDWTRLQEYEKEDTTANQQTLACTAGACDIVDVVGVAS